MQIPKRKSTSKIAAEAFKDAIEFFKNISQNQNENPKISHDIKLDSTPIFQNKNTYTEKPSLYKKFDDYKTKCNKSQKDFLFKPLINEK